LNASNNPLIIIDGVPIGDLNPAGVSNPFTLINPNDIESFSIFKDATSTALYGARGANGVIYVTTKQGVEGPPRISMRAEGTLSMPTKDVEFADPVTYMKLYNDALYSRDPFAPPIYSREKIDETALKCWNVFGLRGYARVDLRVDQAGNPLVIEVNANPCISPDSGLVAATIEAGIPMTEVISRIISDLNY